MGEGIAGRSENGAVLAEGTAAAGAVVTHDIPSNVIAAGVPARILKEI